MKSISESFAEVVDGFSEAFLRVQWEDRESYAFWVRQQLALVSHTTRFICLAAARTEVGDRDAHNEWLHHLKGETNHDLVIQKDLSNLGFSPQDFAVSWSTSVIRQNQYYWLQNHNPISLCGYSLLLEGMASKIAPKIIERLEKKYQKNQYAFLTLHAHVDQGHFEEGLSFIEKQPAQVQRQILENLAQTEPLYKILLDDVAKFGARSKKSAA